MKNSLIYRNHIKSNLNQIREQLNQYLRGEGVSEIKDVLERVGRGGRLPHWYEQLESGHSMPNLDGKTIGSVIEMVLLGVLEKHTLVDFDIPPLTVNPAKGVDIPFLDLGVKSPSENNSTSEPFFSAYDRILGNEYDAVILLTDYQTAKKSGKPPIRIQVIKAVYLKGSEIADKTLCGIARKNREYLLAEDEPLCKKAIQFLCHVNQSDWRAKKLMALLSVIHDGQDKIDAMFSKIEKDFHKKLKDDTKKGKPLLSIEELNRIIELRTHQPLPAAIINACSDWVIANHNEFARFPNENEWTRFIDSPLDGKIGISFALQWRYGFGSLLGKKARLNDL